MAGELAGLDVQVDGAQLLDLVCAHLRWWVKFPSPEAADAATLYTAATHAAASLQFASRLRVKSPQKRCGKSRLLEVESWLVRNPLRTANISAAALVRSTGGDDLPTIVFDEADATFGKGLKGDEKAEALRGILNAGFDRNSPYVRWDVSTRSVENCPTFAMAIIAGIGDLPDTIEDRAVPLTLTRKTKEESCLQAGEHGACPLVHKFRPRRDVPVLEALRDQLAAWVLPRAEVIGAAEPDLPAGLNDRAEDVWEALIAVADQAGGSWPQRARAAAVKLMADAETSGADRSLGIRLLADLRIIFTEAGADHIGTTELTTRLCKLDESPWKTINHGMSIDANKLAALLRPYEVKSEQKWELGNTVTRGYFRASLEELWARYLPPLQDAQAGGVARAARDDSEPVTGENSLAGQNGLAGYPAREDLAQVSDQGTSNLAGLATPPAWNGSQSPKGYDWEALYARADHSQSPRGGSDDESDWQD